MIYNLNKVEAKVEVEKKGGVKGPSLTLASTFYIEVSRCR